MPQVEFHRDQIFYRLPQALPSRAPTSMQGKQSTSASSRINTHWISAESLS